MQQISLTLLPPGNSGKIAGIKSEQNELKSKLAALGVLPGLPITVIQNYPVYLIQIDRTQLALDNATAKSIQVIV